MKFTYDPETGQYRDSKGRVIDDAALRRIQADSESSHMIELMSIAVAFLLWRMQNTLIEEAERLSAAEIFALVPEESRAAVTRRVRTLGPVSAREYQAKMQEQIALAHRVNTVLATGGFAAMTISAWNYAETRVREETAFEVRLAGQTAVGLVSPAQLVNRSSMYAESTYKTFSASQTRAAQSRGVLEARRILDPRAEHCEDCPELASSEWERIEAVKPIGESVCGPRCRCYIQYRKNTGEQEEQTPLPQVPRQSPGQVILPPAQAA